MAQRRDEVRIAAFESGELRVLDEGMKAREAVLALPLSRFIAKLIRVPKDADANEVAAPILKAMSPFPDEDLTIGFELVKEDDAGKVMIAAALPESAADDIGEALDAAKVNVVKIDIMALGTIRGVWKQIEGDGRRLVLLRQPDCISMLVLDGQEPSALRAITDIEDLNREVMLSLLEAEDFGGAKKLEEIVIVNREDNAEIDERFNTLSSLAPIRAITVGTDAGLVGIAERNVDEGTLNALPESWREVLEETRFKRRLTRNMAIAGVIWALVMGVLFGVPVGYGFATDYVKSMSKDHAREFKAVSDKKSKTELVEKYSDHARGALEIMKAVSDRLPEAITLNGWDFKRGEDLRLRGDSDDSSGVYKFKDDMAALEAPTGERDDDSGEEIMEKIFKTVDFPGTTERKGKVTFDITLGFKEAEENE